MQNQSQNQNQTNQNNQSHLPIRTKVDIIINRWELKNTMRPARENASDQIGISFSFAFDSLEWWRGLFRPIEGRSKAKSKQSRFTFDTKLKNTLDSVKT